MEKQEQIASLLDRHIPWERPYSSSVGYRQPRPASHNLMPRPTPDELAHQLVAIAEAESLKLGNWLGTTDGQILSAAVEMVLPPFYADDLKLLVDALQRAAELQHTKDKSRAGVWALGSVLVAALLGFSFWRSANAPA